MRVLLALLLLGLTYTIGLDSVFWALDQADTALRSAYDHAAKQYPSRHYPPARSPAHGR